MEAQEIKLIHPRAMFYKTLELITPLLKADESFEFVCRCKWHKYDVVYNRGEEIIMFFNSYGEIDRTGGPSIITESYYTFIRKNKVHNINGPAYIKDDMTAIYYVNDLIHNEHGPAAIIRNKKILWCKNGHLYVPKGADNMISSERSQLIKKFMLLGDNVLINRNNLRDFLIDSNRYKIVWKQC